MGKVPTKGKSQRDVVGQIRELYDESVQYYKKSVAHAIKIGELLSLKKEELSHGEWLPWVTANLPFSERSARNYISLYQNREQLKTASVADLNSAYKALTNFNNQNRDVQRTAVKKSRKEFADKPFTYINPKIGQYTNQVIAGDNYDVMQDMLHHGMEGKYSAVICSPPYDNNFYYGNQYDDNQSYDEYMKNLLAPFPLYTQLLRKGGRVIYIVGNIVKRNTREEGDYNYQVVDDLKAGVKKIAPALRFYNTIIWDKGGSGKNPLNNSYGTFCSAEAPVTRCCYENILVWSNEQFQLENIEGKKSDITAKEFKEWAWSLWSVGHYSKGANPHPCSFPPKLIERLLKFYTYPNDWILDSYAGAGITGKVCKKLSRRYTLIELNPNYCEYALNEIKSA